MKKITALILSCFVAGTFLCLSPKISTANPNETGVVLLHGMKKTTKWISPLVKQLEKNKIKIATPEMTWSENRNWDASLSETMAEIDNAVASLRNDGATKIIIGGHSIGASAAALYAAEHSDIAGVLLIAPGHTNEMEKFQKELAQNVELAKQKINDGKGDKVVKFSGKPCTDVARSNPKVNSLDWSVKTTPEIYLSHFDPDFKDSIAENVQKFDSGIPILWIAGKSDSWTKNDGEKIFGMAPQNPKNKYIVVKGGHLDTPSEGKEELVSWVMDSVSM